MTKVLVTGADGFIGSHVVEALVRRGYSVKAFTQYNSLGTWGWLDECDADVRGSFEPFPGDIRDPNGVRVAMEGCDTVLHLASLIAIPYSYHSPDSYVDTNIKGSLNVFQAARDQNVSRIVHTSTSEVYGTARYAPIDEEHPLQGQSPYSATKIAADQLAFAFHCSFDLPVMILRPFNTFGPRQSARAVIPSLIMQLAAGASKVKLGAIHPTRDFSFVEDTVAGFIAALESPHVVGEVINLGAGYEISIGELANVIAELMGVSPGFTTEQVRLRPEKSEVERLLADNRKAARLIGWQPQYRGKTGLMKGLAITRDWFIEPRNLAKYKTELYNL